jgi:hypothetical protein
MDLAFHLRAERLLTRAPDARVDYDVLVAALGAHQSQSATARAAATAARSRPAHQVAELVLGGGGWEEAKRARRGSFNPGSGT